MSDLIAYTVTGDKLTILRLFRNLIYNDTIFRFKYIERNRSPLSKCHFRSPKIILFKINVVFLFISRRYKICKTMHCTSVLFNIHGANKGTPRIQHIKVVFCKMSESPRNE